MNRLHSVPRGMALLLGMLFLPSAYAANECQVRYAYAPAFGQSTTQTVNLDAGQSVGIHRPQALYVENRKSHPVRVYRTGIGSYVDLQANGRDPQFGNYPPNVTLQTIECHVAGTSATPIEQVVANFFQAVVNQTVAHLNQLSNWGSNAQQWASRTASDWGSCPSNGAQSSYNQLKTWHGNVSSSLQQANQIRTDAETARANCNATTNNHALCNSTYNTLPVHGWIASLTATRNTLDQSMNAMRALQCPTGCGQTAQLAVPTPTVSFRGQYNLANPGMLNLDVCTNLDLGSIGFNPATLSTGNLAQVIQSQPPRCTATTNLQVCTDWDLNGLLALLQRMRLVPPRVGEIQLEIPDRTVTVPSAVGPGNCADPLRVCVPGGNVTISVNEGQDLFSGNMQCSNHVTVGCRNPAFGLNVTTRNLTVPDLTRAVVRWTGASPGTVNVDLTRRDFANLCRGGARTLLSIPRPPAVSIGSSTVDLPFLCTQVNWGPVVANP